MEKLILEYIMYRLNEKELAEDEKYKLCYIADLILDMHVIENQ
ncbi:hypothetical protein SAMN04488082_10357 [Desulfomicrobium apsheronum]|uniref:Uncharacterized protein n=1 Tax=Desulfomicrobium apsheronum TaxID=52560 RepID=A0A1I3RA21_9BACT|nr:hypothetical protein SAMN04488082_10357 [Desulfomicrobium apsheronum]